MRRSFFALAPVYTALMMASDSDSMVSAAVFYAPIEEDPFMYYSQLDIGGEKKDEKKDKEKDEKKDDKKSSSKITNPF